MGTGCSHPVARKDTFVPDEIAEAISKLHARIFLKVLISDAKGLGTTTGAVHCVCAVEGKTSSDGATLPIVGDPASSWRWNQEVTVRQFSNGDILIFTVVEDNGEQLGRATLPGDCFMNAGGFLGAVPLSGSGLEDGACLTLRVWVGTSQAAHAHARKAGLMANALNLVDRAGLDSSNAVDHDTHAERNKRFKEDLQEALNADQFNVVKSNYGDFRQRVMEGKVDESVLSDHAQALFDVFCEAKETIGEGRVAKLLSDLVVLLPNQEPRHELHRKFQHLRHEEEGSAATTEALRDAAAQDAAREAAAIIKMHEEETARKGSQPDESQKTEDPASQLRRQASHHRDHARLLGLALVEVDRSGLDSIEDMTRAEWMECNKVFKKSLQTSLGQTRYAHLKATYEQFRKVVADVYQGDDSLVDDIIRNPAVGLFAGSVVEIFSEADGSTTGEGRAAVLVSSFIKLLPETPLRHALHHELSGCKDRLEAEAERLEEAAEQAAAEAAALAAAEEHRKAEEAAAEEARIAQLELEAERDREEAAAAEAREAELQAQKARQEAEDAAARAAHAEAAQADEERLAAQRAAEEARLAEERAAEARAVEEQERRDREAAERHAAEARAIEERERREREEAERRAAEARAEEERLQREALEIEMRERELAREEDERRAREAELRREEQVPPASTSFGGASSSGAGLSIVSQLKANSSTRPSRGTSGGRHQVAQHENGRRHGDPGNLRVASALSTLGSAYRDAGKLDEALEHNKRALSVRMETYGDQHIDTAFSYTNVGAILRLQGKLTEAYEYYQKALEIRLEGSGEWSTDTATCYTSLGAIMLQQGDLDAALENYLRALEITREFYGEKHPETAARYNDVGATLESKNQLDTALEHLWKGLQIQVETLGDRHPGVGDSCNNVGAVLWQQGRLDESLEYHTRALEIRVEALGDSHPDTALSFGNVGVIFERQGKFSEAVQHQQKALEIRLRVLGDHHSETAASCINVAIAFERMGNIEEALDNFRQASKILQATVGNKHPWSSQARQHIRRCEKAIKNES